ncbi:MAG: isoaspartyl peptidase/L-asparaginase [Bacteroidales bacterium]|nr:isoaspartyl peptidase/L-asparaginase [Bacteroidales bacterium]
MKYLLLLLAISLISCTPEESPNNPQWAIVIHGGAGNIKPDNLSIEKQVAYKAKLTEALEVGSAILKTGGTSLDAVEATIHIMENSPLFNAGKGAVFNALGQNEMDASIMYGKTGKAGAVAGVRHIKNPISAAIAVMEESPHVLLIGQGAEDFASYKGIELIDTAYFFTERRWESYKKLKQEKYGTVGCVALDKQGHITAGTSTGGMTMKMPGRVGDSPIIGAGTYADNGSCGISATGHGEFFMRHLVAYDIAALMKYSLLSLSQAAQEVIQNKLKPIGGSGGVIGLDKKGNIITEFNTQGMFRGRASELQEIEVAIFK